MATQLDLMDIYKNQIVIIPDPKSKKSIGNKKSVNKVKKHIKHVDNVKITPYNIYKIYEDKKRKLKNKSKVLNADRYWKNQLNTNGVGPDIEESGDFNEYDDYHYYGYWDDDDWYELRYNANRNDDYDDNYYSYYFW